MPLRPVFFGKVSKVPRRNITPSQLSTILGRLREDATDCYVSVTWKNGEQDYTTDLEQCSEIEEVEHVRRVFVQFDWTAPSPGTGRGTCCSGAA